MNTDTMQLLSALLALFAVGGSLVLLVARLTSQRFSASRNFVDAFRPVALPLAFMVPAFLKLRITTRASCVGISVRACTHLL